MWVIRLLYGVSQLSQLGFSSFWGRCMSSKLQLDVYHISQWWRHLVNAYEVDACMMGFAGKNV